MGTMTMTETQTQSRARIALIGATLVAAGIMIVGAIPKFVFAADGAQQLATALGVGRGIITFLGVVEAGAALLLLVPATRALGAMAAAGTMAGALFSHLTILGFSGSAPAEMWPLAIIAFVAAGYVAFAERRRLPIIGSHL